MKIELTKREAEIIVSWIWGQLVEGLGYTREEHNIAQKLINEFELDHPQLKGKTYEEV